MQKLTSTMCHLHTYCNFVMFLSTETRNTPRKHPTIRTNELTEEQHILYHT